MSRASEWSWIAVSVLLLTLGFAAPSSYWRRTQSSAAALAQSPDQAGNTARPAVLVETLVDPGWDRFDHFFTPTIAISTDGRLMALAGSRTGGAGHIHLWDLTAGRRTRILHGFARVTAAAFSRDGRFVLAAHDPGALTIWDVESGALLQRLPFPKERWLRSLVLSRDGSRVAVGGQSGTLYMLTVPALQESWRTKAHLYGLSDIAFASDDAVIYTVGDDQHIYLWNGATGQPNAPIHELRRDNGRRKGHTGMIKTVLPLAGDTRVVTGAYWEGGNFKSYESVAPPDEILRLWDLRDGGVAASFKFRWGIRCCIQQLGESQEIAFINTPGWAELDGPEVLTLQVLDLQTRRIRTALYDSTPIRDVQAHGVQQFRIVPGNDFMVVGLRSGQFQLWNARTGVVAGYLLSRESDWLVVAADGRAEGSEGSGASSYRSSPGLLRAILDGGKRSGR